MGKRENWARENETRMDDNGTPTQVANLCPKTGEWAGDSGK